MYQNVNYNQPPPPSNPFEPAPVNYGGQPMYQPHYAPGYQPGPPAYNYNPAPQYAPNMHQPIMLPDDSMNGGKIAPFLDQQIRKTLCWDIVLNIVCLLIPLRYTVYQYVFSVWFFFVWVNSILAQRRYTSMSLTSLEKRRAMESYKEIRKVNRIILWIFWVSCLGFYVYVMLLIESLTRNSYDRQRLNVTITSIFLAYSLILIGNAVYIGRTQNHIIMAANQA